MGSSNFVLYDQAGTTIDSDATWATDALRTNGGVDGQPCPAHSFNKGLFQPAMFVAAMGQMLATKGYVVTDGDPGGGSPVSPPTALANLAAVLANILTNADAFYTLQDVTTSGTVPSGFPNLYEASTVSGVTRTLYMVSGNAQYTFKNFSTGTCTIAGAAGQLIDGLTSLTVPSGAAISIISTGSSWLAVSSYGI